MKSISQLLKALWFYIAGIITVMIIYYLLTGVDQGIDVVMQVGEYPSPALCAVLAILLWAYLVWYSSRYISYIKQSIDEEIGGNDIKISTAYHQHIPRLLAVNCFASIQYAILCLPTFLFYKSPGWLLLGVLAVHNISYFGLIDWFSGKSKSKRIYAISLSLLILNGVILAYLLITSKVPLGLIFKHHLRHKFWLPILGLILLVFEIVMIYLFALRRKYIDKKISEGPSIKIPRFIKQTYSKIEFFSAENTYFRWFNVVFIAAIIVYFIAIFSMGVANTFGPLAFALLALGVLLGISNIIKFLNLYFSVNVSLLLFIVAILVGKECNNPYKVQTIEASKRNIHSKRPTVKKYFDAWLSQKDRRALLQASTAEKPFDVYLVLSNGGGSRAGDWVSKVLCQLQDSSDNKFGQHLLCIAGASGGTVGNCVFYSLLRAQQRQKFKGKLEHHASVFFASDFLTFTLGRMLGLDIYRHFIPLNFDDRAAALADVMAGYSSDTILQRYFNMDVDSIFDSTAELPFLFMNSTRVEDGSPGVISLTQLPERTQRLDLLDSIDKSDTTKGKSIKLCTVAILSSRFPYISPAGKVGSNYYVDGGYFDNSGAGIMLEFMEQIKRILADTADSMNRYTKHLNFHIVHINNSKLYYPAPKDIKPLENDLLAPVLTLMGLQESSTKVGDGVLANYLDPYNKRDSSDLLIEFSLYDHAYGKKDSIKKGVSENDFPMSWVNSYYQLWRINKSLTREDSINYKHFKNILPK
ncbi:MAG TPA: hypothetical protein VK809_02870 [Bacteroidia bacterium]|jgi:hypothetical protein|nr:hypothetical protein [Bacteroidia bacterium]